MDQFDPQMGPLLGTLTSNQTEPGNNGNEGLLLTM